MARLPAAPMDASPPAGMAQLMAESDAREAKIASLTPAQRAEFELYCERRDEEFDRRTAAKRAQGFNPSERVDFSAEWRAANEAAGRAVANTSAAKSSTQPISHARESHGRQAGHRRRSPSRSSASGDSGDSEPPAGSPPAARWRRFSVTVDERFVVASIAVAA
jgi:hypothetical protein